MFVNSDRVPRTLHVQTHSCPTRCASDLSALRGRHGDAPFSQRMAGAFLDLLELFVEAGGQSGVAEADRGRAIADFVDSDQPRGGAEDRKSTRLNSSH